MLFFTAIDFASVTPTEASKPKVEHFLSYGVRERSFYNKSDDDIDVEVILSEEEAEEKGEGEKEEEEKEEEDMEGNRTIMFEFRILRSYDSFYVNR